MILVARRDVASFLTALLARENLISLVALGSLILFSVLGGLSGSDDSSHAIYAYGAASLAAALLFLERLRQRARLGTGPIETRVSQGRDQAPSRKWRVWLVGAVGLSVAFSTAYVGNVVFTGNFGQVVAGQAYRSGQLSKHLLRYYVGRYGIKTVLNLRGANPGQAWYDNERVSADALGVRHVDFRMSAKRILSQTQAEELIAIMAAAPKPILIHCASGADRTGLAAALYLAAIAKSREAKAEAQMSLRYGHIPLPFLPNYAMTRSWERLEPLLGYVHDET